MDVLISDATDAKKRMWPVDMKCTSCGNYLWQYQGENVRQWDTIKDTWVHQCKLDILPCPTCHGIIQDLATMWGKYMHMQGIADMERGEKETEVSSSYRREKYGDMATRQRAEYEKMKTAFKISQDQINIAIQERSKSH